MKRTILKKYNSLISLFLSLLGIGGSFTFTNCDGTKSAEYGTPNATFKVYGQVTSEDGIQIPYIKVGMSYDSSFTNENGEYTIQINSFPSDQNFQVEYIDVDGAVNGSYKSKDTIVEFNDPQFINGEGSWYRGETSKKVDIQLEEDN